MVTLSPSAYFTAAPLASSQFAVSKSHDSDPVPESRRSAADRLRVESIDTPVTILFSLFMFIFPLLFGVWLEMRQL